MANRVLWPETTQRTAKEAGGELSRSIPPRASLPVHPAGALRERPGCVVGDTALALSLVPEAGKRGPALGRVCCAPEGEALLEEKLTSSRFSPEIPGLIPP